MSYKKKYFFLYKTIGQYFIKGILCIMHEFNRDIDNTNIVDIL